MDRIEAIEVGSRSIWTALGAALLLSGCAGARAAAIPSNGHPDNREEAKAQPAPARPVELPRDPREASWPSQIQFVDDDYSAAREKARQEKKPLFVDSWATWCHSCLSMRSFVLPDAGLRPIKDAVIWLSIETEQEKNRGFVEKFPVEGLPTFLMIDPDDEQILGRWLGSGSANELRGFVEEGVAAYRAKRGGPAESEAAQASREGDVAAIRGDSAAAAAAYRRAAGLTPRGEHGWAVRIDLLAGVLAHGAPDAVEECVKLGRAELDAMPADAVGADFAATVAGCAQASPNSMEAKDLRLRATGRLVELTEDPSAPFSVDDRSDVQASLAELLRASGEAKAAERTLRKREKLLEAAAAKAPDVETAATFDAHRTDCYLQLHELDKAEALLSQREKELPDDYNPPARLARVLLEGKKLALAEAAVERALGLMTQGPRRVGILALKAKILDAEGKPTEEVLREELAVLRGLPSTQRRPQAEAELEKQLAAAPAATPSKS